MSVFTSYYSPLNSSNAFLRVALASIVVTGLLACGAENTKESAQSEELQADGLIIVDCLLPPQLRKLGKQATYMTPRRPIKTTGSECEIRGGEYVAYDRSSYSTALKTWLPLAQQGDPDAQTNVGEINEKGMGIPPDYKVAAMWYQKAADQGFSRAQINLGHLYEKGLGVPKSTVTALNWYRKASGLSADNLEYTSSLQALSDTHKEEVISLKNKLKRVKTREKKAKLLNSELALMRKQVNKNKEYASKNKLLTQQIQQLEASLQSAREQKADLLPIQQQILALQGMVKVSVPELSDAPSAPNYVALAQSPPGIEIIDPPITLTRGSKTAMLKPVIASQEIIGKITAPYGLKLFEINNKKHDIDKHNLFWVTVPISQQETPITIKAEDKQGNKVDMSFSLFSSRSVRAVPALTGTHSQLERGIKLGDYYAVIIGNNSYKNYPDLKTAITDAEETARVLQDEYGFKTLLLRDATRYKILSTFNRIRRELKESDNLLIYYAGHGEIDKTDQSGYWLPVDARQGDTKNWISNSAISDILGAIKAKHVMVVVDSCYSGTLSTTSIPRSNANFSPKIHKEWIEVMTTTSARMALTSGGVQPVIDSGGGKHSVFAKAFLDTLSDNKGLMEGYSLYTNVLGKMKVVTDKLNVDQIPDYAPIQHAGHEAGEFFFQRM
ncbi:hypothetical protein MNBD_GAMMA11-2994 [hydrothermal vent metagenome]|uniref:Peptidase C14 caspase domain-containing protein n=1 Tax=hydrothermal vent metagenome TaxID=652676 RepID=A0A3B0WQT0_9ZZZZ